MFVPLKLHRATPYLAVSLTTITIASSPPKFAGRPQIRRRHNATRCRGWPGVVETAIDSSQLTGWPGRASAFRAGRARPPTPVVTRQPSTARTAQYLLELQC